jgi:hypothetical protein
MGNRHFRSCFISAPVGLNTQPLLFLLRNKGIIAYDAYTSGYDNLVSSTEDKIKNSDFLIAVLAPATNNNVLYEVGYARGANKPILLIVQNEVSIPSFLMDTVYVRTSLEKLDLISMYLDQFISKKKKQKAYKRKKILGPKQSTLFPLSSLEERLQEIRDNGTAKDFLLFVKDFFQYQGILVEVSHGIEDKGVDMSIWIDNLQVVLGNPILVELKMGNLTETTIERAEIQMRANLLKANLRTGLIIYLDRKGRNFQPSKIRDPLVMRFDIYNLTREFAADHSIDRILYEERNKIAHQS